MNIVLPPVPENLDHLGRFTIVTRTLDEIGQVVNVHRAPVAPCEWNGEAWVPTDIASLPEAVRAFATAVWTDATVERFKIAFSA